MNWGRSDTKTTGAEQGWVFGASIALESQEKKEVHKASRAYGAKDKK
jgi:hypothetical protein